MRYGLALPTSGDTASAESIGLVAEGAERIGLDAVWVFERLLRPTHDQYPLPDTYKLVYAPLEVLAYAAAKTSRIRLGTSVVNALFYNPVSLGRSLATLDRLSNGRIVAGIGQGWMPEEFEVAAVPLSRKGDGFRELVEAIRAVWGPDPVAFEGRFYTIAESYIGPKPVQEGGVPLLAGAMAPAAIERAVALGMGINPVMMAWDQLEASMATFRQAEEKAGREPGGLPFVVRLNSIITDEPVDDESRGLVGGSVEQVLGDLARLDELGVDEVFWSMEPTPPEAQLERMERLLAAVS